MPPFSLNSGLLHLYSVACLSTKVIHEHDRMTHRLRADMFPDPFSTLSWVILIIELDTHTLYSAHAQHIKRSQTKSFLASLVRLGYRAGFSLLANLLRLRKRAAT